MQHQFRLSVFIPLALSLGVGTALLSACNNPALRDDHPHIAVPSGSPSANNAVSTATNNTASPKIGSATGSSGAPDASTAPTTSTSPATGPATAPVPNSPAAAPPSSATPSSPANSTSSAAHKTPRFISDRAVARTVIQTEVIKERQLVLPLFLTGHVDIENGGEVDVSTRIAGRLTKIAVKPGDKVVKGMLLAMIESREVAELEGEMLEAKSKLDIAAAHAERERQVYEEQLARPKALLDARARMEHDKVKLELTQSEYHRVESLYKEKIAAGKDYIAAKAAVSEAKLEMEQAQTALLREEHLYKDQVLKKDYQVAMAEVTREKQHLSTIQKRLEFLGVDKQLSASVLKTGTMNGLASIVAPVDGVVNHYEFATGEMVHPDNSVFKLTDLRNVAVKAELPEADLQRVKIGDHVKIKVTSYPDEIFEGKISFIAQHVNLQSHSLSIRAHLDNSKGKLKPNMYAEIDVPNTSVRGIACPKSAVQEQGGQDFVYVKVAGGYEERPVKLETSNSHYAEVLEGLKAGEIVVTEGSRSLRSTQ